MDIFFSDGMATFRLCQPVGWLAAPTKHLPPIRLVLLLRPLVLAPHPPSTMIALASLPLATLIIGATAQVLIL